MQCRGFGLFALPLSGLNLLLAACATTPAPELAKQGTQPRIAINAPRPATAAQEERRLTQLTKQLMRVQEDLRGLQAQSTDPSFKPTPVTPDVLTPIPALVAPPPEPTVAPTIAPPAQASGPSGSVTLAFAPASSAWSPASKQSPAWLEQVRLAHRIVIIGTSKVSDNRQSNEKLALARARTVRDYLLGKGIAPGAITLRTQLLDVKLNGTLKEQASREVRLSWGASTTKQD